MRRTIRALGLCLGVLAFAAPLSGQSAPATSPNSAGPARTFRWVDEQGETHYSDRVPPDQLMHRRTRLSPQGQELETIDAPKTAEQLRREQQLKHLRVQQEKILAEQRDQDLALLRTYRSEEEMYMALKGKLDILEASLRVAEANRQRQQNTLAEQEQRAAEMEKQGHPVPQSLRALIEASRKQVAEFDAKIRSLNANKDAISERFTRDIARYKAMASRQKNAHESLGASLASATDRAGTDEIVISAIACAVGAVCDRAWELARSYVLEHSGSALSLETERILQTPLPASDEQFGMTVTRIRGKSEDILFLDMRCRSSSVGEALCSGPKVREIRVGFKPYIEAGLAAGGGEPEKQGNR
jgi:hypothetical protein